MDTILTSILLFMIYSFIGWLWEVILSFLQYKKFVNRGFFIGPICPIYGFGALIMTLFLQKYMSDPLVLFIMCVLVCSVLEYMTSLILEKMFKTRWWDYSKQMFNVDGRISLTISLMFGVSGLFLMYTFNKIVLTMVNLLSTTSMYIIAFGLLSLFILDVIVSFKIIFKFKSVAKGIAKDATQDVNKFVRNFFISKSYFYRRILKAFPNLEMVFKRK